MAASIHPSAIVDEGATLGDGCRVWHFVHISAGARIGARCSFGQGVYVGNGLFVHAPHTGDVVKVSSLSDPSYASRFAGARRYA